MTSSKPDHGRWSVTFNVDAWDSLASCSAASLITATNDKTRSDEADGPSAGLLQGGGERGQRPGRSWSCLPWGSTSRD